jgi:hypothetical protein
MIVFARAAIPAIPVLKALVISQAPMKVPYCTYLSFELTGPDGIDTSQAVQSRASIEDAPSHTVEQERTIRCTAIVAGSMPVI